MLINYSCTAQVLIMTINNVVQMCVIKCFKLGVYGGCWGEMKYETAGKKLQNVFTSSTREHGKIVIRSCLEREQL